MSHKNNQVKNEKIKILIVDDEPDILEFREYNLLKENFAVLKAKNGKEAISIAEKEIPDLILLDIMMPELDGIETCRILREDSKFQNIVIAFLTARSEDYSQIAGFNAGADDYITKPIKPRVLISRINALLRRIKNEDEKNSPIQFGDLTIDREKYLVQIKSKKIILPKKEFELLSLLAHKPGNVFTREVILDKVWGQEVIVGDRTIDVHIRKLREKIGEEYIKTIKGIGYKFEF